MRRLAAPILALMALGCGRLHEITAPGGLPPVDPSATLTRVQGEILTTSCAVVGCHDLLGRQQNLVLTPGQTRAQTVGVPSEQMPAVPRVAPGDPSNSYLYRKVIGTGITGDRMPQGGPPLTDSQLALIRDWIRRGAPND